MLGFRFMIEFIFIGIFIIPFSVGKIYYKYDSTKIHWLLLPIIGKWVLFIVFFLLSAIFLLGYLLLKVLRIDGRWWRNMAGSLDQTANTVANGNMDLTFSARLGAKIKAGRASKIEKRFNDILTFFDVGSSNHAIDARNSDLDEKAMI